MAIRDDFLPCNAQAIRFENQVLAPPACMQASRLLPNSPLKPSGHIVNANQGIS
jgi:hypothetical protein